MPRSAERHRTRRHRGAFFPEPAPNEYETIGLIDVSARRRNVTVVGRAAAVARHDVAIVEHGLSGAEDEVDVPPDLAPAEISPAGVGKERVLIASNPHIH